MTLAQIIEETNKIKGLFFDNEMVALYPFIKKLKPNNLLVEIGTYHGKSTRFFSLVNPNIKILTLDLVLWKGESANPWHGSDGIYINEKVLKKGNIFQIKGDSSEIAKRFNWGIDFLFIDGCHEYNAVQKDINSWTPYIVLNGYVAFHDYRRTNYVVRAVNEWIKNHKEFIKVIQEADIFIAKRIK